MVLFYGSLFAMVYVYVGYPAIISAFALIRARRPQQDHELRSITIAIAAHNEEKHIEATILNKLSLDYPPDRREIIVISDASTDRTDEIVRKYRDSGVTLLRQEQRAGKTAALNSAVPQARGEIIVFSDANSMYAADALKNLVSNFHDRSVGYVTGKMIYTDPDGTTIGSGCSLYMRYENFLRQQETMVGSVVGVDGGIDAIRKELYVSMKPDQLPDFVLPLHVVRQGYRVVYEPRAILKEPSLKTADDEYRMRVRVSLRALWALFDMRRLLGPSQSCLFAWQLWSHKVLRYLCFVFMVSAYASNIALLRVSRFYALFFAAQTTAYAFALISPILERYGIGFLYIFNYFVLLNGAAMHAFVKFLRGERQVIWTPRKG